MINLNISRGSLREIDSSDLSKLLKISLEEDVVRDFFITQYTTEILDFWKSALFKGKSRLLVNCPKSPDVSLAIEYEKQVCGLIAFNIYAGCIEQGGPSLEPFYFLGKEYRGRGIMNESLNRLKDFAFNYLDVGEVHALVNAENISSIRVLEKAGFNRGKQTLHMRSLTSCRAGYTYNLTKEDFISRGRK